MPSTSSSPCLSIPPSPSVLYASQPASCLFQGIARRPLPWHARARHRQPRHLPRGRLGARRHDLDAPQPLRELGSLPRPTRIASIALSLPGELPISSPSLRCLRCRRWTPGMRAQSSLPSSPAYRRSPLLALVAIRPSPTSAASPHLALRPQTTPGESLILRRRADTQRGRYIVAAAGRDQHHRISIRRMHAVQPDAWMQASGPRLRHLNASVAATSRRSNPGLPRVLATVGLASEPNWAAAPLPAH
jgi:hypothetical protein